MPLYMKLFGYYFQSHTVKGTDFCPVSFTVCDWK